MPTIITTPRPPLNLFEVVRTNVGEGLSTVYEVPKYRIPANGPDPQRDVEATAIITGVLVANTSVVPVRLDVGIVDREDVFRQLIENTTVPVGDYVMLALDRQVMLTDERLQIGLGTAQTGTVHFSFILNQRESFEVIT